MVERLPQSGGTRLRLTPNRSLSWRENVRLWLALCALCLPIAVGMALAGAWLVLPFAGLELAALAAGLYYTARQCQRQEVLEISADDVHLEKGLYRKQAEWTLPRRYTRVHLIESAHPWVTPPKLFLTHRDTEVALAGFLNIDDTRALIDILERHGLPIDIERPLQVFRF